MSLIKYIEELERQLAERDAEVAKLKQDLLTSYGEAEELSGELAKYRDAPVVWIHSGHLHQALNQPFLCRVLPEQCEGYKPLIVKPGE